MEVSELKPIRPVYLLNTPLKENAMNDQTMQLLANVLAGTYATAMKEAEARMQAKMDERLKGLKLDDLPELEKSVDIKVASSIEDINTDSINGLEDFIGKTVENSLEDLEVDSDNVSGLDDAIENEVQTQVEKAIRDDVEADNIRGLDEWVGEYVDNNIGDWSIRAEQVDGLDKMIAAEFAKRGIEAIIEAQVNAKVEKILGDIVGRFIKGIMMPGTPNVTGQNAPGVPVATPVATEMPIAKRPHYGY